MSKDALLDLHDPEHPSEAAWPAAKFVTGNPPFLGGDKIRQEFGDATVDTLFKVSAGRVPAFADPVCYVFCESTGAD